MLAPHLPRSIALASLCTSSLLSASPLQEALDVQKKKFEDRVSAEKIATNLRGIDFVRQSSLLQTAKNVGDTAPDFTLPDAKGNPVSLAERLKKGPVMLTWYRGGWCPYCNLALQEYQSRIDEFTKAGVQIIALTPETPDSAAETIASNQLNIEVLTDKDNGVADQFGIVMQLAPEIAQPMQKTSRLKKRNGDSYDEGTLPLAATYLITTDGTIHYAFLDPEYRNRASAEQILLAAERMTNPDQKNSAEMVTRTFWNEIWNPPYNLALIDSLAAEDFEIVTAGKSIKGRENFKQWIHDFQQQLSNLRFQVDDLIESDGKVVTRWTCSGRNQGLFGSDPDQKAISFTGITITEVVDGKMKHKFVERSAYELYQENFLPDAQDKDFTPIETKS